METVVFVTWRCVEIKEGMTVGKWTDGNDRTRCRSVCSFFELMSAAKTGWGIRKTFYYAEAAVNGSGKQCTPRNAGRPVIRPLAAQSTPDIISYHPKNPMSCPAHSPQAKPLMSVTSVHPFTNHNLTSSPSTTLSPYPPTPSA